MIGYKNNGPADREANLIREPHPGPHKVIGTNQKEIQNIYRPFMGTVSSQFQTQPLDGMKDNQKKSKGEIMKRRKNITK